MDISQMTILTPSWPATSNNSSRLATFFFFMSDLIIAAPIPAICIFESLVLFRPLGSMSPNILSMRFFPLALFRGSRRAAVPQNV
jgi:hypothetical protein